MFPQLNLPPLELRRRIDPDGVERVFDQLRGKYVALTPEEWVRQHFVGYMVGVLGYPAPLMANEVGISFNGMSRRCDTVLYSRQGLVPLMIIEYKAPDIALTRKVFEQILRYNIVLKVKWLVVSNGLQHYCCSIDYPAGGSRPQLKFHTGLPRYDDLEEEKPT